MVMKLKLAFALTLLVLTSLLSFSNRCRQTCDGRKMMVEQYEVQDENAALEDEPAGSSLLRIAVTL